MSLWNLSRRFSSLAVNANLPLASNVETYTSTPLLDITIWCIADLRVSQLYINSPQFPHKYEKGTSCEHAINKLFRSGCLKSRVTRGGDGSSMPVSSPITASAIPAEINHLITRALWLSPLAQSEPPQFLLYSYVGAFSRLQLNIPVGLIYF